jgi:hypothetical protein
MPALYNAAELISSSNNWGHAAQDWFTSTNAASTLAMAEGKLGSLISLSQGSIEIELGTGNLEMVNHEYNF